MSQFFRLNGNDNSRLSLNTYECLHKFLRYVHLINDNYDDDKELGYLKIYKT